LPRTAPRKGRSIRPGRGRDHRSRIVGQPFVVVTADPPKEREAPRSDAQARKRCHGDRARELRDACRPTRVDVSRLLDEGIGGQEVEVARAPRPVGERFLLTEK
jgi:hypothetical protein